MSEPLNEVVHDAKKHHLLSNELKQFLKMHFEKYLVLHHTEFFYC